MKIVVVGASGLVGQQVTEQLRDRGHTVTAVARTPRDGVDHALDAATASPEVLRPLLAGHDGLVFAAGVDDRDVPRRPSYPVFFAGNVTPVVNLLTAAREEGLTRAAVVGSYYTHFHREHPSWDLTGHHPYVRSRVAQAEAGRAAAGSALPVAILELPFVFGRSGDRVPNWAPPLTNWARSGSPLLAPVGGSAVTTARRVGEAAADALEAASGADIPVVDENLTWAEMLGRLATAAGRPRRVRRLPSAVVRASLGLYGLSQRLGGQESGLFPPRLADLMLRELFIEPAETRSVDEAIAETVRPQRS